MCFLYLSFREQAEREKQSQLVPLGEIVRILGLTDPAMWTEARYTRHLSLTDTFSPFQDVPGGIEHFPAGSIVPPPPHLFHRVIPSNGKK